MLTVLDKETAQPLFRDIRSDRLRIAALAGYRESFFIDVAGEDLNGSVEIL
jgi:hypothetical protein